MQYTQSEYCLWQRKYCLQPQPLEKYLNSYQSFLFTSDTDMYSR
nr:MAG TPA: BEACH domain containing protein [Caudoviricetes sp.]